MNLQRRKFLGAGLAGALATATSTAAHAAPSTEGNVIALRTMGSFAFGGTVDRLPDGTTFHGDHGYAQYYVAAHSRTLPIVMWHGIGQSGKTYESTPDGREGYQALLPRRDWSVYIVDQPRLYEREKIRPRNSYDDERSGRLERLPKRPLGGARQTHDLRRHAVPRLGSGRRPVFPPTDAGHGRRTVHGGIPPLHGKNGRRAI